MKEHKILKHRFLFKKSKRLREEGAFDTSALVPDNAISLCVLYRIEDKTRYVESKIYEKLPNLYNIFQSLDTILKLPEGKATQTERELAKSFTQKIKAPYEGHFLVCEDHPGMVYSPGKHKLEYNLAWICGVAQGNKTALLLSLPSRKNFLRRRDDGSLSAFAYELGALYKVGYRPLLSSDKEVYMLPPTKQIIASDAHAIVPNLSDMMKVLKALHTVMFPKIVHLSKEVKTNF